MLDILYEDNHLIAVNKRPGDLVQRDKTGDIPLVEKVKIYIKKKYNKQGLVFIGVIHRLDRPTSGVVLFARTSKALTRMNQQFKNRETKKKSYCYNQKINDSKKGILHYKKIKKIDRYCVLEITLETGRHHQIRSQLSFIGYPIKGDLKYNAKRSNPDSSIDLHARSITISHPTTKKIINITARPPIKPQWNFALSD